MNGFRKRSWLLLLIVLISLKVTYSQVADRVMLDIDKLYILPLTSFCDNRITLVAEVTTRSNGAHLGYTVTREKNCFYISDCFFVGMLTVINHFKILIPLDNLEPGDYYVKYIACPSGSSEKCLPEEDYCVSGEIKFRVGGKYQLHFTKGWNIISPGCQPYTNSAVEFFKPLMTAESLVKVQDDKGNSIEDYGIFNPSGGWYNSIDTIHPSEGYKVKVNADCLLEYCGFPVEFPFTIPLKQGWNIIGNPCKTEAEVKAVVQQLIDRGTLIKVQDEQGNCIEDMGVFGGWQDHIGTFMPGKGYKVKVSAEEKLTINGTTP